MPDAVETPMPEPGIYFGMPDEEYHLIQALGYTDHKALLLPVQWQGNRLRQLREDLGLIGPAEDPDKRKARDAGKRFGHALHKMVEGADVFDAAYSPQIDMPDDWLATKDQLREALGERVAGYPKNTPLEELVMLAKRHGLGNLATDWPATKLELLDGRKELSVRWVANLRLIGRLLDMPRDDHGGKSIRDKALSGGHSEVSLFWYDDGVPCKARIDYLKVVAVVDPKTFFYREGVEFVEGFVKALKAYAYDIQPVHYLDGLQHLPTWVREGRVFGDVDPAWIARVAATPNDKRIWTWVGIQTGAWPEVDLMEFDTKGLIALSAFQQVLLARKNYRAYVERFGLDQPWVAGRGVIRIEDATIGPFGIARGEEKWTAI